MIVNQYKLHRHSADERLNPPLHHSRYVHLVLLRDAITRCIDTHFVGKRDIFLTDLGCGEKPYFSIVRPKVKEYVAVDLAGNPYADYLVDTATNQTNLPSESSDIVWSIQVLEHVQDPQSYLKEAYRLLRKDGKLILSTHGQWMYHPDPIDNWRWTSTGLKQELDKAGFEVHELKGIQGFLSVSIQFFQDACLLCFPFAAYWRRPFCFVMQRMIAVSEWFINKSKTLSAHRDMDAAIYLIVATKK